MARRHPGWANPVTDFSIEHDTQGVLVRVTGAIDDEGVPTTRIEISTPGATGALQYSISENRQLVVQATGPAAGELIEAMSELAGQLRAIAK